jgi:hypothetical protein
MADDKRIKKQATNRTALIKSLLDKLEAKVQTGQRELLKRVVNDFLDKMDKDEDGNIKNTLENKRRFSMFDQVYNRFAKDNGLAVVQSIADGVSRIVDFNAQYFAAFTGAAQLGQINANVKETLAAWLGITTRGNVEPNGYLDTLVKDPTVKNQIKNMVLKSVVSQAGYFETKKALQDQIEGTPDKLGALQKYYRNFAYDTYSVVDRTNGKIFADKLNFNYAIYEGGLIETSRKFCEDHNGKVFSRDEIAKFKPTEAIGPGYDPFTDLGGYGCRHHLNWVPDSVAFALRPELKGQATPPAKAEPPKQVEAPTPAAKGFNFKHVDEARQPIKDMFKQYGLHAGDITIHKDMTPDRLSKYVNKLAELTGEYNLYEYDGDALRPEISFSSGGVNYGYVSTIRYGNVIKEMNFGHTSDPGTGRLFQKGATWFRSKSAVDPENLDVSTAVHEFGHVITTQLQAEAYSAKYPEIGKFWTELKGLKRKYSTELNKLTKYNPNATPESIKDNMAKAYALHLGDYASTNNNEFMAEAWTEYKLNSNPSKYAVLVGKLIDKYFKK